MTAGEIVGLAGGILAAISTVCAIIVFFTNRGKDRYKDGQDDAGIKGDIKYMRNSFDDLRLDVKEVARKQDSQGERLTRVEESVKSAHHRIDELEHSRNQGGKKNDSSSNN